MRSSESISERFPAGTDAEIEKPPRLHSTKRKFNDDAT